MLPFVKPGVCASIGHDLTDETTDDYIEKQLAKLKTENPTIEIFIRKFMKFSEDPDRTAMCGIMVYLMLESQIESDLMEEQIRF